MVNIYIHTEVYSPHCTIADHMTASTYDLSPADSLWMVHTQLHQTHKTCLSHSRGLTPEVFASTFWGAEETLNDSSMLVIVLGSMRDPALVRTTSSLSEMYTYC